MENANILKYYNKIFNASCRQFHQYAARQTVRQKTSCAGHLPFHTGQCPCLAAYFQACRRGGGSFNMLLSVKIFRFVGKVLPLPTPPKKNMGPTAPLKSSRLISHPGKVGS